MNNDIFEQLKKVGQKDIHDPKWVRAGEKMLRAHIASHPFAHHPNLAHVPTHGLSGLLARLPQPLTAFITVAAIVIGGLSVSAQAAIPGNTLYRWKTDINEPVQPLFVVGTENRARFDVELTSRRLSEITAISMMPGVSAVVRTEAEQNFEVQAQKTQQSIAELKQQGTSDTTLSVWPDFKALLDAHQTALTNLRDTVTGDARAHIDSTLQALDALHPDLESSVTTLQAQVKDELTGSATSDADARVNAQVKIDQSAAMLDVLDKNLADLKLKNIVSVDADAKAQMAHNALDEARMAFAAGAYAEVITGTQNVLDLAAQAKASAAIEKPADSDIQPTVLASPEATPTTAIPNPSGLPGTMSPLP